MAAADLVSLPDAKAFVNVTGTASDGKLAMLITRASMWMERIVNRRLKVRTYTNLRITGPDGPRLYPPAWPIDTASGVTIKVDEIAQTVWRTEADGDVDAKDVVVASDDPWDDRFGKANHFYRWQGWASALGFYWRATTGKVPSASQSGQNRVLLTYRGGYATMPDDLQQACLYLVQKLWRDQDRQQTGMTVISIPQGGAVTIPEPAIPREVLLLLEPYRRFVGAGV